MDYLDEDADEIEWDEEDKIVEEEEEVVEPFSTKFGEGVFRKSPMETTTPRIATPRPAATETTTVTTASTTTTAAPAPSPQQQQPSSSLQSLMYGTAGDRDNYDLKLF